MRKTNPGSVSPSRKTKTLKVTRKLRGDEKGMKTSPLKSPLPKRLFDGTLISRSLLGEPELYEESLDELRESSGMHGATGGEGRGSPKRGEKHSKPVSPVGTIRTISMMQTTTNNNEALDTYRARLKESAVLQRRVSASRGARRTTVQVPASLSLSLSLSNTHIYISFTLTRTHTRTYIYLLSLSLSLSHTHTHTHTHIS